LKHGLRREAVVALHNRATLALGGGHGRVVGNPARDRRAEFGGVALHPRRHRPVQIMFVHAHPSRSFKAPGFRFTD